MTILPYSQTNANIYSFGDEFQFTLLEVLSLQLQGCNLRHRSKNNKESCDLLVLFFVLLQQTQLPS